MNTVSVLLVTHSRVGRALLETAQSMLQELPFRAALVPVSQSCNPDKEFEVGKDLCRQLNNGQGVLILTDAFGSTPSNIANRIAAAVSEAGPNAIETRIVAGVNLPMVLKIANYPNLTIDELAANAVAGGQRGVMLCNTPHPTTANEQ